MHYALIQCFCLACSTVWHNVARMALATSAKQPGLQVRARCSAKLKRRVKDAYRSTGQDESTLVRVALEDFFERHRTPSQIAEAVIAFRTAKGEAR
jgi:hypothetical protein